MSQKGTGAGRGPICARHEDGDDIADFRFRQHDLVRQPIERRAQAPDDGDFLFGWLSEPVCDRDRVISPHDRPEIAARGKLVMQSPVNDQEGLAMAFFAIYDPRQIHARLTDQPAAKFDSKMTFYQYIVASI